MNKIIVDQNSIGLRLDNFIQQQLKDISRSNIKKQIEDGYILVNNKLVKSGVKLKLNDEIIIKPQQVKELSTKAENIPIDILYQDDDLAVINKQKGLVVHPANGNESGTLVNALLYNLKNLSSINGVVRPGIVHRIDKDTSGLILVAKNDKSHISLAKQIEEKTCHRYYKALCHGNFKQDEGEIITGFGRSKKDRKQMASFPVGEGKLAKTEYKVLERFGNYTLVEFCLYTGRTHQIRVHCKYLNHPIVGDEVYGHTDKNFKTQGQLLHAYKIEFNHPSTNKILSFTCEVPEDFEKTLKKLRNTKN